MPSLKQAVADKQAQEQPTLRKNPEIDAKLDKFIAENPKLLEYYSALSKDDLIRKQMLGKMQRSEYNQRSQRGDQGMGARAPRDQIENRGTHPQRAGGKP